MSDPSDGGYNGLKAFGFTVGVTVLIFAVLYAARRYNPNLFGQEPFSRSYSWYARGPNDSSEIGQGRSLGERPIMWDVWIASWYPPTGSPSERLGVGRGEDKKRDLDGEKKPRWAEFFPLSADRVSEIDTAHAKGGNPFQPTSPTQIQINTIILMPAPPRPTSSPSTSSQEQADTYCPPKEYTLGTSHIPCIPGD